MKLYTEKQLEAIRWLDWARQKLDSMMVVAAKEIGTAAGRKKVEMYGKFKEDCNQEVVAMGIEVPDVEAKELLLKYIKRDDRGLHDGW
jgi:hypothetical protein